MSRSASRYSSSSELGPFSHFINVNGVKVVSLGNVGGQESVAKQFTLKVARVFQDLLSDNDASIDSSKQNELISYLSANEVIQRIGVSSYDSYRPDLGNEPGWDDLMDSTLNTDFIWQLDGESGKSQATEVIEHVLHTVTRFGLPGVYEKEFDYSSSASLVSKAFEEAKQAGVYSTEEYSGGDQDDLEFQTMLKQEYLYCLIYANWGMIESHVDGGSLSPEWSDAHLSSELISQDNPLGQQIFDKYISSVISRPLVSTLDFQFKDLGGGVDLYTPDGISLVGSSSNEYLEGDHGSDVIAGKTGADTLIGYRGFDSLSGDNGNDELRAGNGRDIIAGGAGADMLYGGFGLNTFDDELDGEIDQLYFRSDQWVENYLYEKAGNSPNGEKADKIEMLDEFDQIYVQGVETSQLSYGLVDHNSNLGETLSGIGIYASGALEAVYVGGNLSMGQIAAMTQGIL